MAEKGRKNLAAATMKAATERPGEETDLVEKLGDADASKKDNTEILSVLV